jgi:CheY-like chemotaxis protein
MIAGTGESRPGDPSTPPQGERAFREGTMRILLIDDDDLFREVTRLMLESGGHEVIEAKDGRDGLVLFRQQPVDAVVTDIIMPQDEGIGTIRKIRALNRTIRIIAISGSGRRSDPDFLGMAARLGATYALAKPFEKEELLACVEGRTPPPA